MNDSQAIQFLRDLFNGDLAMDTYNMARIAGETVLAAVAITVGQWPPM